MSASAQLSRQQQLDEILSVRGRPGGTNALLLVTGLE